MAEPPYGVIANRLQKGQVIPFLGAGVNFGTRPPGVIWDETSSIYLPSSFELARFLARIVSYPDSEDRLELASVASYFVAVVGRRPLDERLKQIYDRDYMPTTVHQFLAKLDSPMLIVTTNYDTVLEQAFHAYGRPYDLVTNPFGRKDIANGVLWWKASDVEPRLVAVNELDIDLQKTTVIYKLFGEFLHSSYVITQEDFVELFGRMQQRALVPTIFLPLFRKRSFLFIGYGMSDWKQSILLNFLRRYG